MSIEQIEKFLETNKLPENKLLKFSFRKRSPVYGIFVTCNDAAHLQSKNFWRIVTMSNVDEWKSTKNLNLSRIFNGTDFVKIAVE